MNTERELIQQLRDAHQSLERLLNFDAGDGFHNYVHHDKELIAAADAYLSKQDWIRVEDALPVVPESMRFITLWLYDGRCIHKDAFWPGDSWLQKHYTHWYLEQIPEPPKGASNEQRI